MKTMPTPHELLLDDCRAAVERARADFESLRGQRLLVTGGTGFFGAWLLECLALANRELGLGCKAWVLTRDPKRFAAKAPHLAADATFRFIEDDVRSFASPNVAFDTIIHGAAQASAKLNAEDPSLMADTIVAGTRRVLGLAAASGNKPRVLFVSSGGVYGRQPPSLSHVDEDFVAVADSQAPKNAYNEAKRQAELECVALAASAGLEIKIARCFAFVGPHLPLDTHFAVGNFIGNGLRGEPIVIKGDGTPYRSYQYAADLVVWLLAILNRGAIGRPYNVGSDEAVSIADLARAVASEFAPPAEVRVLGVAKPGVPAERYVPSVARAQTELGVTNAVGLREGIRKTIAWHRAAQTTD